MIEGVLFDMDGVLFDTEVIEWNAWREIGEGKDFTISNEVLESMCSVSNEVRNQRLREALGPRPDLDEIIAEQKRLYCEELDRRLPLKNGVRELLPYLKQKGYRIAVASSSKAARVASNLERSGLTEYFDALLSGDQVERYKPAPDIYLAAAEAVGLPPDRCLAVEDSRNGLLSAVAAGCVTVMVPDLTPPDEEIRAMIFAVLDNLLDVVRLLEKMPQLR